MKYSIEKKKQDMSDMLKLIPHIQETVRKDLQTHFEGVHQHDKEHVEEELAVLRKAIDILSSKYVFDIIFVLSREGEVLFFNELKSILTNINPTTLSSRLKMLEHERIIKRQVFPNERPIRVSYELSELGHGIFWLLLPLLVYVTYNHELGNPAD